MRTMYAKMVNCYTMGTPMTDQEAQKELLKQIEDEYLDKFKIISIRQGDMPHSARRFTEIKFGIK